MSIPRRFILDNDGYNLFSTLSTDFRRDVDEAINSCPRNVTTYMLCCGAGTCYYPSTIATVDPRCKQLGLEHGRGNDPFGYFVQQLKADKRETFITFRMNDVHDPNDNWNIPAVRRQHPDCIVDQAAAQRGDPDWMNYCLNYARPEVTAYFHAFLRDVITRYRPDGLQLDWMRFPRHLAGSAEEVWAARGHLTRFVTEVRAMARAHNAFLSVRVPTSLAGCRRLGIDVAEWTRLDLVDFVSTGAFLNTDFFQPLTEMRAAMGDKPVPIYGGFDFEHGAQFHSPESLRATCSALYASGADGINLFNFPCWREYLAAVPYHWLEGLESPETAARKPHLYSVPLHRMRTLIDLPGLLPAPVPGCGSLSLPLPLPSAAFPVKRSRLLLRIEGECHVAINGQPQEALGAQEGTELFAEFILKREQPNQPIKEQCRLFRVNSNVLQAGDNLLTILNPQQEPISLLAVNLAVW